MFVTGLLVLALQAPTSSPAATPAARPPAQEKKAPEATKGLKKSIRGTFGGIDVEQMTVRFVDEKGQQKIWPVDRKLAAAAPDRAEMLAKAFQPGEPIYVSYHEDDGHPTVVELVKRTAQDDELDKQRQPEGRN